MASGHCSWADTVPGGLAAIPIPSHPLPSHLPAMGSTGSSVRGWGKLSLKVSLKVSLELSHLHLSCFRSTLQTELEGEGLEGHSGGSRAVQLLPTGDCSSIPFFLEAPINPTNPGDLLPAESLTCWGQKLCFVVYPQCGSAEEEHSHSSSSHSWRLVSDTAVRKSHQRGL